MDSIFWVVAPSWEKTSFPFNIIVINALVKKTSKGSPLLDCIPSWADKTRYTLDLPCFFKSGLDNNLFPPKIFNKKCVFDTSIYLYRNIKANTNNIIYTTAYPKCTSPSYSTVNTGWLHLGWDNKIKKPKNDRTSLIYFTMVTNQIKYTMCSKVLSWLFFVFHFM